MSEDAPTWSMVAAAYPGTVQRYVQERDPLPDGPVTEESWEAFRAWVSTTAEGTQS